MNLFLEEKSALAAGLVALKQQDYHGAIATLGPLTQSAADTNVRVRARIALVNAYEKLGDFHQAMTFCHPLTTVPSAKIKDWATQTLRQLTVKLAQSPSASRPSVSGTGFVPLESTAAPSLPTQSTQSQLPSSQAAKLDLSPTAHQTPSGFAPLNALIQSSQEAVHELPADQQDPADDSPVLSPGSSDSALGIQAQDSPQINSLDDHVVAPPPISGHPTRSVPPEKDASEVRPEPESRPLQWRQAGRADQWRRLKRLKLAGFQIEQGLTAIALLWFIPQLVNVLMDVTNDLLYRLPWVNPIQLLYKDPTRAVWIILTLLFLLSPWILDFLLQSSYGMEPLPMTTLFQYSPEANRVLRSYCQQRRWNVPALRVLPTLAPLAMTYGCWPRFARIVVSQGLLEQLAEDEIALIYAREMAQVGQGNFLVMSFITLVMQVPYLLYSQLPRWPEQFTEALKRSPRPVPNVLKTALLGLAQGVGLLAWMVSPVSYGIYRLLRWPALWVARRRVYYSDRTACDLTGNPNGLVRALLKITQGVAQEVEQRGKTDPLLESFDLLTPVGVRQALTFGSLMAHTPVESLLQWDRANLYRRWLELNQSHPVLGDRLQLLCFYANFWQLESELDLPLVNGKQIKWTRAQWSHLLLQGAPFFGIPAGVLLGSLIWLVGGICSLLGIWQLEWLLGDRSLLFGCILLCCSLGIFLRINAFFPQIQRANLLRNPDLSQLFCNPKPIPVEAQSVQLEGKLLGRTGVENGWEQDLILQMPAGLVYLHHIPQLTPLTYLWPGLSRPSALNGQSVTVIGWWRRGATPWLDLERMQTQDQGPGQQRVILAGHPIWSTLLGVAIAGWGAYVIAVGKG
ncbi:MAG: M48 family metalloprotease [Microcoleaceae cyanobacterium]